MKELIIVEGRSAEQALQCAIDRASQQVFAIQGKFLNVGNATESRMLADDNCARLLACLDCGYGEQLELSRMQFEAISILMDPDIDGRHTSALLLTFFATYLRPLAAAGKLRLLRAPLYRLITSAQQSHYAFSEQEYTALNAALAEMNQTITVTRYKSVAQLTAQESADFFAPNGERRHLQTIRTN